MECQENENDYKRANNRDMRAHNRGMGLNNEHKIEREVRVWG